MGTFGVDAVLVEQIDDIRSESLERSLGDLSDMLRLAVHATLSTVRIKFESELGCNDDLFTEWREGFAHDFFVFVRTVGFCGVEERDAILDGRPDE